MADLSELIKTWRQRWRKVPNDMSDVAAGKAFRDCADELERALAAQPAPAGEVALPEPHGYIDSLGLSTAKNSTNFRLLLEAHRQGKPSWSDRVTLIYTADQLRAYGDARAAAAVATVTRVPGGFVLAPVEPDAAMMKAGRDHDDLADAVNAKRIYRAMIAAAPQPIKSYEEAKAGADDDCAALTAALNPENKS